MKDETTPKEQTPNVYKSNKTNNKGGSTQKKARNADSKIIHDTLAAVKRKVKNFKSSHLADKDRFSFPECLRCLQEDILPAWEIAPEKIKDYEDFLKLTLRKEPPEDAAQSDEYIDLISLSKRAREFQAVLSDSKRQILTCMEKHVVKSCSSLKEMAGSDVLLSVEDYTNHIATHKGDIEAKWEEMEQNVESYKNFLRPFEHYVEQGEGHSEAMSTVCNNLLEVCKLIDKWVTEDDGYPEKLMEEYEANKKIKENLNGNLQQLEAKKNANIEQIEKLQKREKRAYHNYTTSRRYKHTLQTRRELLEDRRERINTKLEKKRSEPKAEPTDSGSPGNSDNKKERNKEAEIKRLESDLLEVEKQLKKLQSNFKPVNDRTYEHKVDTVTFRHQREELQKENVKLDEEMKSVQERMSDMERQNNTLVKIRDMKLSEEAYRRNMRDKQKQDAAQSDGSQRLNEACQYVASIGKHWRVLYYRLPFNPARDIEKRDHDIDLLDYLAAKNDVTESELVIKSLSKWQMFHRKANVGELVSALKETKFTRLANDLEMKFLS